MISSSVLNSVTFKNLDGENTNKWNTLHNVRKQAGFTIGKYWQRFNKDDVIYLQFESDSATVPDIGIYIPFLNDTVSGTLASSYSGLDDRYFYNFEITLGAAYYDKEIQFILTQDTDTLTSEPIYCCDISEDLSDGKLKKIKYTNLDRNESDLSDRWVDWSVIDFMYFYVEGIDIDPNDTEESEVLEGSQSKSIISATNYSGIQLQTGGIPDYLVLKLKTSSSLDYFEVNNVQYIKDGEIDVSRFGGSTLHQISLNLTEKNTIGLNVDDVGITYIDQETTPMATIPKRNTAVTAAGWQVSNPEGYMLHSVFIKHAATSSGDAVVNLGTSVSGSDLIDSVQGNIPLAGFSTIWKSYSQHYLKNPDAASTLYFTVTGAGAVLDIICNFDTVETE